MAMNLPLTGGCLCGSIRYAITEAPQLAYTCHCRDCQNLTSSAFAMAIVVRDEAFQLMGIEPRSLQTIADSGRIRRAGFAQTAALGYAVRQRRIWVSVPSAPERWTTPRG